MPVPDDVIDLVYKEARFLDERSYEKWVDLYTEDAYYWMPSWKDDDNLTTDPNTQVSLLLLEGKGDMLAYVRRILTGKAWTYVPHPRTIHIISNVFGEYLTSDDMWKVNYNWVLYVYRQFYKDLLTFVGNTEMGVVKKEGLKIKYKKVVLMNDYAEAGVIYLV